MEVLCIKKPYEVSFTGNPIHFVYAISPYRENDKKQLTQLLVNVLIEQTPFSDLYIKVKSQSFFPSADGLVEVDVRAYVDPYLSFTNVPANLNVPINCESQARRFKISVQLLQNNAVVTPLVESDVLYAVKGGLPYEQWHPSEYFSEIVLTQKKALNYEAAGELVGKDETRYMFWLYPFDDESDQTVNIVVHFADGSTNTYTYDTTTISTIKWAVCCMAVGYNRMNLDSLVIGGKDIVSYTVAVLNNDDIVIASKRYYLDYRTFYRTEQILYRNSLGAVETIRLRGQIDFEADYVRQNASKIMAPAYFTDGILNNQNSNYFSEETEKKVGDTGFLSKAAQQKIRALFLAEETYELVGDKLLPVIISSANAKFYSNRDSLIAIQIEWKKAYANQFYLPVGVMPLTRTCPNMLSLVVRQTNRNNLRVMWSIPFPYDRVQVIIRIPDVSGGFTDYEYLLTGNSGAKDLQIENTLGLGADMDVIVKGRVICNQYASPMEMGAQSSVTITVNGPSLPIARNDYYRITAGYGIAVTLSPSVLNNDEDPDGDAIEVLAAGGATIFGGTYTINADGIIVYTPPSSEWVGQDAFIYTLRKVALPSLTDIAFAYINSANDIIPVWVKIIDTGTGSARTVTIHYYSNSAGTVAVDVTGFGLTINYNRKWAYYTGKPATIHYDITKRNVIPAGSTTLISTGEDTKATYVLTEGTGYTII